MYVFSLSFCFNHYFLCISAPIFFFSALESADYIFHVSHLYSLGISLVPMNSGNMICAFSRKRRFPTDLIFSKTNPNNKIMAVNINEGKITYENARMIFRFRMILISPPAWKEEASSTVSSELRFKNMKLSNGNFIASHVKLHCSIMIIVIL